MIGMLVRVILMLAVTIVVRPAAARPPNVIVVLVDDMGWKDLGCQGGLGYETPHIDRLAADGMRLTTAYAACTVCSPTRASLLTGQYPARLHITDWIAGHERPHATLRIPDWRKVLPLEAVTLAERLKARGYATVSIGKWHLGGESFSPEQQGFDRNLGGTERGQPPSYVSPYGIATLPDGPAGEYLTDREALEAVAFIETNRDQPFFLYLPHHCVHTPIQAKPEVTAKYAAKRPGIPPKLAAYAAMVESVDDAMGTILATLDRLGLRDRTAIIFTSDNGGQTALTDMSPLRAGKGSAYEGGVRVPLIVTWPGVTSPGSTTDVPAITPDIPATILDLTGSGSEFTGSGSGHTASRSGPGTVLDGVSLAPLLRGRTLDREAIYWHYPHYHPGGATPYSAIRSGSWRLVHFYENERNELYDLAADPGETTNLVTKHADQAADLQRKLNTWLADVGGQLPTPNPDADPARDRP